MIKGIKVVVEAVDRVTAPIRRIGGSLRNINLAPLRAQLGQVVSAARNAGREIGRMAKAAAVGVAGLAVAAGAILARVASASNAALMGSQRIGISMKAYQGIGYAAERSGAEVTDMADAMKDLNSRVLDAASGNKDMLSNFRRMGVAIRDERGNLRATEDIFIDIADAFERVPDGAKKSAAAMVLMGNAGLKMIPLLNRGGDSIREMMEEAERLGLVLDEETAAGFKELNEDMVRLRAAATGLQFSIGAKLLPILSPLLKRFTDWAIVNREIVAVKIAEWIDRLPRIIDRVRTTVDRWMTALAPVGRVLGRIVDFIGPVNVALGLMAAIIGGKLLLALWPLGKALVVLSAILAKMTLLPVIKMIWQFVAAIRAGTGVMAAFNLVLWANPIGAVILLVAALAGAAYLLYRNWDTVGPYFEALWGGIKQVFKGFRDFVVGVFSGDLGKAFDGLRTVASGLANNLITVWSAPIRVMRSVLEFVDKTFGTKLAAGFQRALDLVRPIIDAIKWLVDGIASAIDTVRGAIDSLSGSQVEASPGRGGGSRGSGNVPEMPGDFPPSAASRASPGRGGSRRNRSSAPDMQTLPGGRGGVPGRLGGGGIEKIDAGGRLDIHLHQDRPATVRATMNDSRFRTDVSAGPANVTP